MLMGLLTIADFQFIQAVWRGLTIKFKVIKRKAYGFHDIEYFSLIIKNAFAYTN